MEFVVIVDLPFEILAMILVVYCLEGIAEEIINTFMEVKNNDPQSNSMV